MRGISLADFQQASDYIYIRTYLVGGKPAEYSVYDADKKEYQHIADLDEYFSTFTPVSKAGEVIEFTSVGSNEDS